MQIHFFFRPCPPSSPHYIRDTAGTAINCKTTRPPTSQRSDTTSSPSLVAPIRVHQRRFNRVGLLCRALTRLQGWYSGKLNRADNPEEGAGWRRVAGRVGGGGMSDATNRQLGAYKERASERRRDKKREAVPLTNETATTKRKINLEKKKKINKMGCKSERRL